MNRLVLYSSVTGNTKAVAEKIYEAIEGEKAIHSIKDEVNVEEYDVLYLGFWMKKGGCDKLTKKVWERIHGKKVVFFGTMAADKNSEYGQNLLDRVYNVLPKDNQVLGHYIVQGQMSEELKAQYEEKLKEDPNNIHIKAQLDNEPKSKNHPNEEDLRKAKRFVRELNN